MIQRKTYLKRNTPVRKRRKTARRGPLRDAGFLRFLKTEGYCVVCASDCVAGLLGGKDGGFSGIIDPAHGPVNGKGSKGPDSGAIPLCRPHHNLQHAIGWMAFEERFGIDRKAIAARWWAIWEKRKERDG